MTHPKITEPIEWTDPPPSRQGQWEGICVTQTHDWIKICEVLRSHPDQWALVGQRTKPRTTYLKSMGLEVTVRKVDIGPDGFPLYDLYARWPEDVV